MAPHSASIEEPSLLSAGQCPALQVVSFHADDTNRGPTFDMELSDLLQPDGSPISYKAAKVYFQQDPAHRSATIIVVLTVTQHLETSKAAPGMSCILVQHQATLQSCCSVASLTHALQLGGLCGGRPGGADARAGLAIPAGHVPSHRLICARGQRSQLVCRSEEQHSLKLFSELAMLPVACLSRWWHRAGIPRHHAGVAVFHAGCVMMSTSSPRACMWMTERCPSCRPPRGASG